VINAIKANGFSKEQRAGLHRLRELYNSIKHDPLFVPSIKDILEAVRHAETFAIGLKETAIGRINVQVARKFHRVFWVAGWDHFIGGDLWRSFSTFSPRRMKTAFDMPMSPLICWAVLRSSRMASISSYFAATFVDAKARLMNSMIRLSLAL
jgi:hypothetical protein